MRVNRKFKEIRGDLLDRREFIRRVGAIGLGAIASGDTPIKEWSRIRADLIRVSDSRLKLGTTFQITILHPSKDAADLALESAFTEVDRLSGLLSRHQQGTPVWTLNSSGSLKDVPRELSELIKLSIDWGWRTGGLFDITVEPVLNLYRESFEKLGTPPPDEELQAIAERIGFEKIALDDAGAVSFKKEGMGVTLDGVAKGFIVDQAMNVLERSGIEMALINAGGDIRTVGNKGGGDPWKIAVQDPWKPEESIGSFDLVQGAMATSGNYQAYFDNEKIYHHIIDPSTRRSPGENASTTIRSHSAVEADLLSTALFVMKSEQGKEYVERLPEAEAFIIRNDGKRLETSRWQGGV